MWRARLAKPTQTGWRAFHSIGAKGVGWAENTTATDERPGRNLDYAANQLRLDFDDNNQIQKVTGVDQARLGSTQETAITTMTSDRIVMDLDTSGDGSVLQTAVESGNSMVESNPVPAQG